MRNRQRSNPHEKSMASYESAAWSDACAIATLIAESCEDLSHLREKYEAESVEKLKAFEKQCEPLIAEFIGKTEGQRPAFLRKVTAKTDDLTRSLFLVLCLHAVLRARDLLELRDRFRLALAPGLGYRVTTRAVYEFEREVASLAQYDWPYEPFEEIGVDDGYEPEDVDDEADLAPVIPLPTPAAKPDNWREIVVLKEASAAYKLDEHERFAPADGSQGAWVILGEDLVDEKIFVGFVGAKKPDDKRLEVAARGFLEYEVQDRVTLLVGNQAVHSALAAVAGFNGRCAAFRKGAANGKFRKWFDGYLDDLRLELSLLREPMPTLNELTSALPFNKTGMAVMSHADPDADDFTGRRIAIATTAIRICALRGRDLSAYMARLSPESPRNDLDRVSGPNKPGKGFAKLSRLHAEGRLSEFGLTLFAVGDAVAQWLSNPDTIIAAMRRIGRALFVHACTQRPGHSRLWLDVQDVTGRCTAASDLIAASVCHFLDRPITGELIPGAVGAVGGYQFHRQQRTGFYQCFCLRASLPAAPDGTQLRSLPYHNNLERLFKHAFPALGITVSRDFESYSRSIDSTSWLYGYAAWESHLTAWLGATVRQDVNRPRQSMREVVTDKPRFVLVSVWAATESALAAFSQNSAQIAQLIESEIRTGSVKAGFKDRVRIEPRLLPFSALFVPDNSRFQKLINS